MFNGYKKRSMITRIREKAEKEAENLTQALKKNNLANRENSEDLSSSEKLLHKVIYSPEEIDFVIKKYKKRFDKDELLENCIYLLEEYKDTEQVSKSNSIYNIFNKYFTIKNCYKKQSKDFESWKGFTLVRFIKCPEGLEKTINQEVLRLIKQSNELRKRFIDSTTDFLTLQ